MEEKKNVTICFNSDEMYIYNHFKAKGKTSAEMKRVLKNFIDNNEQDNDLNKVVDERLAKILSVVIGSGLSTLGGLSISPEMLSQLNNLQKSQESSNSLSEEKEEKLEEDGFNLPPDDIFKGLSFMNVSLDDEEDV